MPDRITFFTNAWESTVPSGFSDVATELIVADASALLTPCFLVVDPDDPASREYILVGDAGGSNTLPITQRNLAGSVGQVSHAANAVVRAVATAQAFEDLHDRISANDALIAANDPSGVYLPLAGGTMAGSINMVSTYHITNLPAPTLDGHAARKSYVDAVSTAFAAADADHVNAADPHPNYLTQAEGDALYAPLGQYLPLTGGTLTGPLTVNGDGTTFATFGPEGTANLIIDDYLNAGNDFRIYNDSQGNGIVFRDSTGGVEILYGGVDTLSVVNGEVAVSGVLSVTGSPTANDHVGDRAYNDARYLGISAKAADANLLDGLNSSQFLRSDTSDTMTGTLTLNGDLNMGGTGTTREIRWDTDTGIYSTGDGNITMRANNQTQMSIGTGGTTINDRLTAGSVYVTGGELYSDQNFYIRRDQAGQDFMLIGTTTIQFHVDGIERMRVYNGGTGLQIRDNSSALVGDVNVLRADLDNNGMAPVGWHNSWINGPEGQVWKDDLVPLAQSPRFPGLDVIDQITPYDYNRPTLGWREWGVVLDQIQEVDDRLRNLTTKGDIEWGGAVSENGFIAMLLLAVQDLRARVTALETA